VNRLPGIGGDRRGGYLHSVRYINPRGCIASPRQVLPVTVSAQAAADAPFSSESLDRLVSILGTDEVRELRAEILGLLAEGLPADGRAARSRRTRRAIVEAMRTLHGEGDLRPRASCIAERAGVGRRTVWQQFADMEALLVEASRRDLEILMTMLWPIDAGLPLDERITRFASRNAQIYERMAPGWRAARLHEPFSAELRRSKQRNSALGKAEIEAVFAPELRRLDGRRRIQLTGALVGVGFWPFWESLRADVGASPEQAQDIVAALLTASLSQRS
jgi:TetR/AcrR family transcriptional regulator, regulator of autoinduction and epiphytic fitness